MALKGRAWVGVCAVAVAAGLLGIQPAGAQAQVAPTCDASSYSLALQSLTGPPRADMVIRITAKVPDCVLPESLTRPGQALAVQRRAREDTRVRRRSGARRSGHRRTSDGFRGSGVSRPRSRSVRRSASPARRRRSSSPTSCSRAPPPPDPSCWDGLSSSSRSSGSARRTSGSPQSSPSRPAVPRWPRKT